MKQNQNAKGKHFLFLVNLSLHSCQKKWTYKQLAYIYYQQLNMIKLYWNIGSQPARAVKALLDIGHIKHQLIEMDLKNNQTRTPQFLKLNPLGQIPFIVTESEQGIAQSNAIMQYLCEKYSDKIGTYYGLDIKSRTKANVMLSWYQSYFRPVLFARIKIKVYGTIKGGIPHSQKQLALADKQIGEALAYLQNFINTQSYITGENVTIADLLVYFQLTNLIYYEMETILKEYKNISRWYDKIQQIPEVKQIQIKWKQTVPAFKQLLSSAKPTKN